MCADLKINSRFHLLNKAISFHLTKLINLIDNYFPAVRGVQLALTHNITRSTAKRE